MTQQACRTALLKAARRQGAHPGLLLSRFLRVSVKDDTHPAERLDLFDAVRATQESKELQQFYQLAFTRRQQALQGSAQSWFTIRGRAVIGLGSESVLETGITLHHTYGAPIIPGAALKGLAAHYCDQVWGAQHPEFKQEVYEEGHKKPRSGQHHQILFGTNKNSGHIVFHDAWITPDSLVAPNQGLVLDVMTPHHSGYYTMKEETAPTDFDSPIPLPFLSVAGTFHVAVSCNVADANGKAWELRALHLLTQALATWGAGGKTNAGYGRMVDKEQQAATVQTAALEEEVTRITTQINKLRGRQEVSSVPGIVSRIAALTEASSRQRCAEVLKKWLRDQKLWNQEPHASAPWRKQLEAFLSNDFR